MAIPGTTKLGHMNENFLAGGIRLTAEEVSEINTAASRIKVQGDRLPPPVLAHIGQ